ncbi:pyridoxamine 5'-phosphate oxidase family protein [Variovorax robiniae]|uniref:Pyridoxamine 5'-phosphate oxidase family protein n=1 Tax=Variovorax robiniae TaxID=1836199 RepID=A0ABU8XJY8_9BURK
MGNENAYDKLWKIIQDTKFGMLTHRHGDGHLHSQPLTTQNKALDEDSLLCFFVARDGDIARHVPTDANVNIAYANVHDDDYVSISGTATISEDQAKKDELLDVNALSAYRYPASKRLSRPRSPQHRCAECWR